MKIFLFFLCGCLLFSLPAFAYSDRVDASAQEIYEAALPCFETEGIHKSDANSHSLTTKWIYKTIRRTRKRSFIPTPMKETVDVRYQMKFDIEKGKAYSDVSIRGRFEEKQTDAPMMQPWKASVSDKEFYFKEREAFFKLLGCIEERKKVAANPVPSVSAA